MSRDPIIQSMVDTDLYKISMAQAVLFGRFAGVDYQGVDAAYEFINRGKTVFPDGFADRLREQVSHLENLSLTSDEHAWLQKNCPFLKRAFLDFLLGFRFDTRQIHISQIGGDLKLRIEGPWYETIYYEVMLMAIISELFFQNENPLGVEEKALAKARKVKEHGLSVAEFGTRRRFSYDVQDKVVGILKNFAGPTFVGTSNIHFALKYGTKAIGTHAHEFFMAHAALFGFKRANFHALNAWADEYVGDLGIALTDTFTTESFFSQFNCRMAKLFDGVRHDSGDPYVFAERVIDHYTELGIDPKTKSIIFSDGLSVDEAIKISDHVNGRIKAAAGIGTHFTNDCGHKPLNMVIKMVECDGNPVVKLSDVEGKHTGPEDAIRACKYVLGLT